jgi:hypothetical protein
VTNDVTLGALQFDTDYSGAPGGFDGSDDHVACVDLTGSLSTFNDHESEQKLSAGFISIAGFDAPRAVMRCDFTHDAGALLFAEPDDFVVTVIDAVDPQVSPVTAGVAVTSVQCGPVATSTTTISTSTTTSTTSTSTTFSGPLEGVGFTLVGTAARVGAVQLAIDYSAAPGNFDGSGPDVDCAPRVSGIVSFNDVEATSTLNVGIIVLRGFTAPRLLIDCGFTASGGAPEPDDFAVTIVDITDTSLNPITDAEIVVTVADP